MNRSNFFKIIVLSAFVAFTTCNNEEPFDVLAAQRQISGMWDCIEDTEKTYQISIAPNGVMNLYIKNLCNVGWDVNINAALLDENNLLIPSQIYENFSIGGKGAISEQFEKLILELHFSDETKDRVPVVVICNKKK